MPLDFLHETSKLLAALSILSALAFPGLSAASGDEQTSPYADWAAPSKDGTKVAYVISTPGIRSAIWIANRDGFQAKPLLEWPDASQTEPEWSPNGQRILFVSNRNSRGHKIWSVGVDGTSPVQLTNEGDNHQPRYSPDGRTIVYTSDVTGETRLWAMDANGSNQRILLEQSYTASDPSWSPDGTRIVFTGCKLPPPGKTLFDSVCNLFIHTRGSATAKLLSTADVLDSGGDWGATDIVFSSMGDNHVGLWMVNPDGSNLRRLTFNQLDLHPKWDHHNHLVVFTRGEEIWSVDLTGKATQLTHVSSANQPPVANAGVDRTVECAAPLGTEVTLDGTASYDPDGDPLTFTWSGDFGVLSGALATARLHPGRNAITLSVDDGKGGQSSARITIEVVDTTPPEITRLDASPNLLWPPNHAMVPVTLTATAVDRCSATTVCRIADIRSNEPVEGTGDGDAAPDWVTTGELTATMRAERSGIGTGRAYTVAVQCSDPSGNHASRDAVVTVPKSRAQ